MCDHTDRALAKIHLMNSPSNADSTYPDNPQYLDQHLIDDDLDDQLAGTGRHSSSKADANRNTRAHKAVDRDALSRLPASHLIRHFLLFAFAVLFLLTMARAGYTLWQMGKVESVGVLISSFLMGLRFDLALIGMLLAVPVFIVPLLAMTRHTKGIGKFFSITWMILALAAVLLLELLTPYTLQQQGLRPDLAVVGAMGDPLNLFSQLWSKYIIPAVIGLVLSLLIFIAFIARLDSKRFLRHPIKVIPAICISIVGLLICVIAATGSANPPGLGFSPESAQVSQDKTVNEITMNTPFKTIHSLLNK